MNSPLAGWRCLARTGGLSLCLLLAGCPDDDGRAATRPPAPQAFGGVIALAGETPTTSVTIGGNGVSPRSTRADADRRYRVSASGLTAPVVIRHELGPTYAVAATVGAVGNVSTLTQLQALEALRDEPETVLLNALDPVSRGVAVDYSPLTPAGLDRARRRVASLVAERFNYTLPAAIANADFVSTPFAAVAGDPTFDALVALDTAIAASGTDLASFTRSRARELEPCRRFFLDLSLPQGLNEFCANTRETIATGGGRREYRQVARDGATLVIAADGTGILDAVLSLADGRSFTCSGSGPGAGTCAGLTAMPEQADGSRTLVFAALALIDAGTGDRAVLDGRFVTAIPGLPPLDCDGAARSPQPLYRVDDDGSISGVCIGLQPSDAGERTLYGTVFGSEPELELLADDSTLHGLTIYQRGALGAPVAQYRCVAPACTGYRVTPFFPLPGFPRVREVVLDNTPVTRVGLGPGSTSQRLRGRFVVLFGSARGRPDCSRSPETERVRARVSTESADWDVCPPYDLVENQRVTVRRVLPADFGGRYLGGTVYEFRNALNSSGQMLVVTTLGLVRRVEYGRSEAERFVCEDLQCRGARFGAADASSAHPITFAGTTLVDQRLDGSATDRSVTLNGALRSAPDCLLNEAGCP